MVSPNPNNEYPLWVGQDSLNNLSLGITHEDSLFIQNPSSSSSSSSPVTLHGTSSFHQPYENANFRQQLAPGVTAYQDYLVRNGVDQDSSIVISPQAALMAMGNTKELGYLDGQLGFPVFPQQVERKQSRFRKETMEKMVERRQRRMIKNRESAARCRARKQAHIDMLEHQVSELRRRNDWLKKRKEAAMVLDSDPSSIPHYQLRRTTSSPF